ncbi:protein kinase [Candidatus Uabimicrobium sp. HlEnr_7]|uniref:protein kinase domain-containing protein n=1 Tax=Candidatus Uabimicrobium helgolandensis TaxID=3095367 RepID=UPI00355777D3
MNNNESKNTTKFDRYEVGKIIGEGGMGRVYSAVDLQLKRKVALKVMQQDDEKGKLRFLREIKTTAKLKHPNIVNIYGSGYKDNYPYFAMEFIDGDDLHEFVQNEHPSMRSIAEIIAKVAQAISYAHKNGVIHRDLKPENIMMKGTEPKVVDFGLARVSQHSQQLSKSGAMMGTVQYMSPEQTQGTRVNKYSDIYSIGVILYELLCERLPFTGSTSPKIVQQILNKAPVPPSRIKKRVPVELELISLKCLEKKPQDRYQDAKELAAELQRFINGEPIKTKRKSQLKSLQQKTSLSTIMIYIITLILLLIILSPQSDQRLAISDVYNILEDKHIAFTNIKSFEGHQYLVSEKKLTYTNALKVCKLLKGHLVTISNAKEKEFVTSIAKQNNGYWTGLIEDQESEGFKWYTGELIENFYPLKSENIILSNKNGKLSWITRQEKEYAFICEWGPLNE